LLLSPSLPYSKGILTVPTGLTDSSSRLKGDIMASSNLSDDENAAAEAENEGGAGFTLFDAPTASNGSTIGRSHLKKGKISVHRAAESGSDSD
jgi:hypothetical protein